MFDFTTVEKLALQLNSKLYYDHIAWAKGGAENDPFQCERILRALAGGLEAALADSSSRERFIPLIEELWNLADLLRNAGYDKCYEEYAKQLKGEARQHAKEEAEWNAMTPEEREAYLNADFDDEPITPEELAEQDRWNALTSEEKKREQARWNAMAPEEWEDADV